MRQEGDALNIREDYEKACQLLKLNKIDAAKEIFENIYNDNPKHFESINKLGAIFAIQGQQDSARQMFFKSLEINPDYAPALCNLGNIYNQNKDFENALKYYQLSIEKDDKYPMAYYNLSVLYKSQKNYNQYLKYIKKYKRNFKNQIDKEYEARVNRGASKKLILVALLIVALFIFSTIRGRYI